MISTTRRSRSILLQVKKCVSCLSTCIFPDKTTYPIDESMVCESACVSITILQLIVVCVAVVSCRCIMGLLTIQILVMPMQRDLLIFKTSSPNSRCFNIIISSHLSLSLPLSLWSFCYNKLGHTTSSMAACSLVLSPPTFMVPMTTLI